MPGATVTAIEALAPMPDLSVLDLAIVTVFARHPGENIAYVAAQIGRHFGVDVVERDLDAALRRLLHRELLTTDGSTLHATDDACLKARFAARGIVDLLFRDRDLSDVGARVGVSVSGEDRPDGF